MRWTIRRCGSCEARLHNGYFTTPVGEEVFEDGRFGWAAGEYYIVVETLDNDAALRFGVEVVAEYDE